MVIGYSICNIVIEFDPMFQNNWHRSATPDSETKIANPSVHLLAAIPHRHLHNINLQFEQTIKTVTFRLHKYNKQFISWLDVQFIEIKLTEYK